MRALVSLIPREVRVPAGAPALPVHTCLLLFVPRYWPGPLTVSSTRLDNGLPSSVQIAPWASQPSVTGRVMMTRPSPSGSTVIRQRTLLPFVIRLALVTSPPVTVKAWSRKVT